MISYKFAMSINIAEDLLTSTVILKKCRSLSNPAFLDPDSQILGVRDLCKKSVSDMTSYIANAIPRDHKAYFQK